MLRPAPIAALALAAALLLAACGDDAPALPPALDSADAVLDSVAAAFERQFAGVETYEIVTEDYLVYYRRAAADSADADSTGGVDFESRSITRDADSTLVFGPSANHSFDVPRFTERARGEARLRTDTLDGAPVYVLTVDDPVRVLGDSTTDAAAAGPVSRARVYVDRVTFAVRGFETEARPYALGVAAEPVSEQILWRDFRAVDGLLVPFETVVTQRGADQMLNDQLREIAWARVRAGREGLGRIEEARRADVAEEIDREETLLRTGVARRTFTVDTVYVNRPVPARLFDQ